MNTEILIVSHLKDLPWLRYALQSICKFGRDFSGTTVLVPYKDFDAMLAPCSACFEKAPAAWSAFPLRLRMLHFQEFPGKGMLDHMAQKLLADIHCPEADFVFHTDSDCIFKEPFTPADYFQDGKPVLLYEPYEAIKARKDSGAARYQWKAVTEATMGFSVDNEFMCRHPAVNPRWIYEPFRDFIESRWGMEMRPYWLTGKNEFPQDRAEFNSLGAFAWEYHRDWYHWIDVSKGPRPADKLTQFWSHSPPDVIQTTWVDGKEQVVLPKEMIEEILSR